MQILVQRLDVRIDRVDVRCEASLSSHGRLKNNDQSSPTPNAESPAPM
jgi:hypothetical protein